MNLYLIARPEPVYHNDENAGFVIAASTPTQARKIARDTRSGDEDHAIWISPEHTTCRRIGAARTGTLEGVVLTDFRAG